MQAVLLQKPTPQNLYQKLVKSDLLLGQTLELQDRKFLVIMCESRRHHIHSIVTRLRQRVGVKQAENFEPEAPSPEGIEKSSICFEDVGGMEAVKEEIRLKIIYPLTHAEMYRAHGKSIGGGILLYGPPGCGKTHLARATAGEIRAGFIPVGLNDILDMWIGNSEKNLHQLFIGVAYRR